MGMGPQSNYDFIMNPQRPAKPRFSLLGHGSMRKRLVMIGGGAIAFIIVVALAGSLLGGGTGSTVANLTSLAQTQAELARVATEGSNQATQAGDQVLAVNIQLTLITQQKALLDLLAKSGKMPELKVLALKKDSTTDAQLTTAQQNSTYDIVFAQIMQAKLVAYRAELKTAYDADKGAKVRALLSTDYQQAALLLKQVPSSEGLSSN